MQVHKLLFHPHVTLAATIGALVSLGAACKAFVAALSPLWSIAPLAHLEPRVNGDLLATGLVCSAAAGVLTVIAGLGRSFVPLIDRGSTPQG